eukprot:tig00000523_g1863.t1
MVDVAQLRAALAVIHAPQSPADQRKAANAYADAFLNQQDAQAVIDAGMQLARLAPENTEHVRHFGLHALEHVVKRHWNSFPEQYKTEFKAMCLNLLSSGTGAIDKEKQFIKEKASKLTTEVALREWPQRWPDLVDSLVAIANSGERQAEMVFLVLRSLPEEVIALSDSLPEGRRNELMQGFHAVLEKLFPFFYRVLESSFQGYRGAAPGSRERSAGVALMRAVLSCLLSYLDWIPVSHIFTNNFTAVFCSLMGEPDLRMMCADCMLLLASRDKVPAQFGPQFQQLFEFCDNAAPSLGIALPGTAPASPPTPAGSPEYAFAKRFCQMAAALGQNHVGVLRENKALLDRTVDTQLAVLAHPSLLLSATAVPFFAEALRDPSGPVAQSIREPARLAVALQLAAERIQKLPEESHRADNVQDYAADDFNDEEELEEFFSAFRTRVADVTKKLATIAPAPAVEFALNRLSGALTAASSHVAAGRRLHQARPPYPALEASVFFLSCVLSSALPDPAAQTAAGPSAPSPTPTSPSTPVKRVVPPLAPPAPGVLEMLSAAVRMLLSFDASKSALLANQLSHAVEALSPYFRRDPAALGPVMDRLFQWMAPGEAAVRAAAGGDAAGAEAQEVGRHAGGAFLRLCVALARELLPMYEKLMRATEGVVASGSAFPFVQRTLLEALAVVSNAARSYEQQAGLLAVLLPGFEAQWNAPELTSAFGDALHLLVHLRVLAAPPPAPGARCQGAPFDSALPDFRRAKDHIGLLLSLFSAVFKRSSVPPSLEERQAGGYLTAQGRVRHPFGPHLGAVLPQTLSLLRSLAALWSPEARAALPPELLPVLEPSPYEVGVLLRTEGPSGPGGGGGGPSASPAPEGAGEERPGFGSPLKGGHGRNAAPGGEPLLVHELRLWVSSTFDFGYDVLRLALGTYEFYESLSGTSPTLSALAALLSPSAVPHASERGLRTLARKVVHQALTRCPPELQAPLLGPLVGPFLRALFDRLAAAWAPRMEARPGPDGPALAGMPDAGAGAGAGGEGGDQREIIADIMLRQAPRTPARLLPPASDRNLLQPPGAAPPAPPPPPPLPPGLACEALLEPAARLLLGALVWPDSLSCRRATALCHRLLPFACPDARLQGLVIEILVTVLKTLTSRHPALAENYTDLIAVVQDAYTRMLQAGQQQADAVRSVLLSIPGATPEKLQAVERDVGAKAFSEKKARVAVRRFLEENLKISAERKAGARPAGILNLPERLLILRGEAGGEGAHAPLHGLAEFFAALDR